MALEDFGLQEDGTIRRPSVAQIRDELRTDGRSILGDNIDFSPGSPHGNLLDMHTIQHARAWEAVETVHHATTFQGAQGQQLDRVLSLVGFSREELEPATGVVTFERSSDTGDIVIPSGTDVSTAGGVDDPAIPFVTTESAVIRSGETTADRVPIRGKYLPELANEQNARELTGAASNVPPGVIEVIDDVSLSAQVSVTNPVPTGGSGSYPDGTEYEFRSGHDQETDEELKRRYENSLGLTARAIPDGIYSTVLNADESIQAVNFEQNDTMNDNRSEGGLPPKSVRVTVRAEQELNDVVAQALGESVAYGIETYGTQSGTFTARNGSEETRYFEWADEVDIYVNVDLTSTEPIGIEQEETIMDSIIGYIGGIDTSGDGISGTQIGSDVIHHRVWNNADPEELTMIWGADVEISTDGSSFSESNITIEPYEWARTDPEKISITTTVAEEP